MCCSSDWKSDISNSLSKIYYLNNHHLESHLNKNYFSISLYSTVAFLYPVRSLESNSRSPSLASEKFEIEEVYI
jgi:hypothetical protein